MAASLARGNPICRKEDCSRFDLGLVYKEISRYSDLAKKFELIQNVWKSDLHFKFPQNKEFRKQRKFRQDWLIRYPWVIYSDSPLGVSRMRRSWKLLINNAESTPEKLAKLVAMPLQILALGIYLFALRKT